MERLTKEYHKGYQQGYADAREEFKNIMRKYQKIEQIFKNIEECELVEDFALDEIREVVEDGNVD